MPIFIGSTPVQAIYCGSASVASVFAGSTAVVSPVAADPPLWSGDPHWASVEALLHFDGADGSTAFSDASGNYAAGSFVANGATISTAQSKFGGSSLSLLNNASLEGLTNLFATGYSDFTIEFWLYPVAFGPRGEGVLFSSGATQQQESGRLAFNAWNTDQYGNSIAFGISNPTGNGYAQLLVGGALPALNQWTHVAITRNVGTMTLWVDGVAVSVNSGITQNFTETGARFGASPGFFADGQGYFSGYMDEIRVTHGVARAVTVPTQPYAPSVTGDVYLTTDLQATRTLYGDETTLTIAAGAYNSTVTGYQWQRREPAGTAWANVAGATTNTLSLTSLTDAADTGASYRCLVTSPTQTVRSTELTLTVDESGINMDNRFRVVAADATTALTAAVDSTTGYWKMVSSTGQDSGVIGSPYSQWSPYYFNTGTVTGMPTGSPKVIEVFACDASGNPSGELEYVSFAYSSQAIVTVDASGCTSLTGFSVPSSTTPYNMMGGTPTLPSAVLSIRAVGVAGSGGGYWQWGPYPASVGSGINVSGQQLDAAALNQLYTDLSAGTNTARIFVGGNPGTSGDDPTIATAKNYAVFGS